MYKFKVFNKNSQLFILYLKKNVNLILLIKIWYYLHLSWEKI